MERTRQNKVQTRGGRRQNSKKDKYDANDKREELISILTSLQQQNNAMLPKG